VVKKYIKQYPGLHMKIMSLATETGARQKLQCMAEHERVSYQEVVQTNREPSGSNQEKGRFFGGMVSKVRFYTTLPPNDTSRVVLHQIYNRKGALVASCESIGKKECIESISPGKYVVRTAYLGEEHKTVLFVLPDTDAYLFASFKKENRVAEQAFADNAPVP
jgi:hypothetical protein